MNKYFKIHFFKENQSFNYLTNAVLPKFIKCETNALSLINPIDGFQSGIPILDRKRFDSPTIENMSNHFFLLLNTRQSSFEVEHSKLKGTSDASSFYNHRNFLYTETCDWDITQPEQIHLVTTTIDEELTVTAWIWACLLLKDVVNHNLLDSEFRGFRTDDILKIKKAATVFSFLAARGTKEGFVRFDRLAPIFIKAYVCKAYEALALACGHLILANDKLNKCLGEGLDGDAPAHILHANEYIEKGYTLLKNNNGADDCGVSVPCAYDIIRKTIRCYTVFYRARFFCITTSHREKCIEHMYFMYKCPWISQSYQEIKVILDDFNSISVDISGKVNAYSAPSLASSLLSFITGTVLSSKPLSANSEVIAWVEINKLSGLPDIPADIDVLQASPLSVLLFNNK